MESPRVESSRVMPRPVAIACAVALLALLLVPLLDSRYLIDLFTEIMIYALFALSLNVLIGFSGNVSFGHAAYFAIGGYTCAILLTTYEWPFAPAFAAAVVASALAAAFVAWFCVRLTDIYFAMLTLAFAMVVWGVAFKWRSVTGGDDGFVGVAVPAMLDTRIPFYYFTLVVTGFSAALLWLICHSAFGRCLVAVRENRIRAGFVGINTRLMRWWAFVVAGTFAGVAGAIFGMFHRGDVHRVGVLDRVGDRAHHDPAGGDLLVLRPRHRSRDPFRARASHERVHRVLADGARADPGRHPAVPPGRPRRPRPEASPPSVREGIEPMLRTVDLFKHFGGFVAIDGVDFELEEGEKHAIIGPNGAGKTTFFHLITGHLRPDRGQVEYEGRELTGLPPHRIVKAGLARSFQRVNVYPRMSVFENVQVALMARDNRHFTMFRIGARFNRDETLELLALVGLADEAGEQAGELAYGKQKQLELAIALAERPRVLLLDEPTAGMSPSETEEAIRLNPGDRGCAQAHPALHRARHDGGLRHRGPDHRAPQRRRHRFRRAGGGARRPPRCEAVYLGEGGDGAA